MAVAGLLLLCLLWSLDSLAPDLFPHPAASPVPQLESEAISFALLAVAAGLFAVVRAAGWPRGRQLWAWVAIGLGMFAAPAVLVSLSNAGVSETTRVALFSLVPVFAVVLEPHLGAGVLPADSLPGAIAQPARGGLMAALAAVAGTLCVFPLQSPGSIAAGAAMGALVLAAACVAAANCAAVRLARARQSASIASMAAIAGAAAAAALAAASALTERSAWRWDGLLTGPVKASLGRAALLELPGLLLLFWLMRRMAAARMTTRFVLAPLVTILIAMALEQPAVELRTWAGLLLVAAGAGWLLLAPAQEPDAHSSPLSLRP
jgi:drug/metabolite transporter (DMT)-like permease